MRPFNPKTLFSLAAVGVLALSACGEAPEEEPENENTETAENGEAAEAPEDVDFTACLVSDAGGWDDQSFNESAYNGLQNAIEDFDIDSNTAESSSEADFGPNVDAMVQQGCDLTFGVGFMLEDAVDEAALANEDLSFGLIDSTFPSDPENGKALVFNTAEAAYLAGYVAAATSETGVVATFGGIQIPSVTVFMDGFADGVDRYNTDNGAEVQLLGWDKESQNGSFSGDFEDQNAGRTLTEQFLAQDADIVMPVAGPVGLGAAAAIEDHGDALLIWVDTDGYESTDYGDIILTSVMKQIPQAVYDTIEEAVAGEFSSEPYIGDLENEGVGLAPFHDYEDEVDGEVKEKIDELIEEIISGETVVESENAPQ
ncbi:BMP family lipoprotein [Nesterenkonia alkaliphila]|uniref:BMP family ABC transporter substrate-binding protein n=1 Tax=Nesterenkonia alkaliphila TaxID=1463631 RepID=A0A7K1UMD6_9MICC|nr:BMP family ABC transporter substrate-binding protein [Nesterenkonia alkaliphila]MVT27630.1 BMP family ABC transporter substrate-binding protein [Nesterenkonia alkaliphila]GFZ85696.1 BMP family ABC transporter substrate-binding protein [Nesterenkonia alkaliphila]